VIEPQINNQAQVPIYLIMYY